ncbi:MarR family transcriptional regulator [Streptomyces sp. NPDC007945]|uniref:MarR family transcriptional regulator n=1 Tax=Streptomyces sp. NPDC007945 TaxID=3364797 RepID=UPI0036E0A6E4
MTTTAPAADSRTLGLAHYAARGVLAHVLTRHGLTFTQQIALRTAVTADAPRTPDELAATVLTALKTGPAEARAAFDALRDQGLLLADGPHLVPTDAGRALLAAAAPEIAPVTARVWAGIAAEDLAAAGRLLARVTENADRELAALKR